jgi:hypothetical protein
LECSSSYSAKPFTAFANEARLPCFQKSTDSFEQDSEATSEVNNTPDHRYSLVRASVLRNQERTTQQI